MGRVEDKLDTIIERLGGIATRADMRNYLLLALALFATLTGVLVTGLGWLETRVDHVPPMAAAPQPIVIQLPPSTPTPLTKP